MTGPDSIFRVSGNKCEKVCHVTGHKQSRKTVKTAFHQNTREHLSGSSLDTARVEVNTGDLDVEADVS